jgi:hypothetical protein
MRNMCVLIPRRCPVTTHLASLGESIEFKDDRSDSPWERSLWRNGAMGGKSQASKAVHSIKTSWSPRHQSGNRLYNGDGPSGRVQPTQPDDGI